MSTNSTSGVAQRPLVALSTKDVDTYRREGFLVLRKVFDEATMAELADDVQRVLTEQADLLDRFNMRTRFKPHVVTGEPVFEVFDPFADLSQSAQRVANDSRLLQILHDLYGEPAELFKDKLIYKPPGAEGATLHQDWIAWPGFPESFLTVLVAIDPFTAESGATEVYPRCHRSGYLSPRDGKHHCLTESDLKTASVPLLLQPGDIAIFGCFMPHRSSPNASSVKRRGYFLSYNARSDGGRQYTSHYQQFHQWLRTKASADVRELLYFR